MSIISENGKEGTDPLKVKGYVLKSDLKVRLFPGNFSKILKII